MSEIIEQVLDVRLLPAPEPFQKVMQALALLPKGQVLRMVHRKVPLPLFKVLQDNGWAYRVLPPLHDYFEILIWRMEEAACTDYAHHATALA